MWSFQGSRSCHQKPSTTQTGVGISWVQGAKRKANKNCNFVISNATNPGGVLASLISRQPVRGSRFLQILFFKRCLIKMDSIKSIARGAPSNFFCLDVVMQRLNIKVVCVAFGFCILGNRNFYKKFLPQNIKNTQKKWSSRNTRQSLITPYSRISITLSHVTQGPWDDQT